MFSLENLLSNEKVANVNDCCSLVSFFGLLFNRWYGGSTSETSENFHQTTWHNILANISSHALELKIFIWLDAFMTFLNRCCRFAISYCNSLHGVHSFDKLIVSHLFNKYPAFHGTRRPLGSSQGPAIGLYLNQMSSVHTFPPSFFKIHFNLILPSTLNEQG